MEKEPYDNGNGDAFGFMAALIIVWLLGVMCYYVYHPHPFRFHQ